MKEVIVGSCEIAEKIIEAVMVWTPFGANSQMPFTD
jgi:hypothetical protein